MTTLRLVITLLIVTALQPSIHKTNFLSIPFLHVDANVSPTPSSSSRFGRKRNNDETDGLTLGDLESMQQTSNNSGGGGDFIIPPQVIFGQGREEQLSGEGGNEESEQQHELKRNLRRIHLDLSGRVMCHVLSPKIPNNHDNDDNNSDNTRAVPAKMNSIPLYQVDDSIIPAPSRLRKQLCRCIPHVFLGANYDLDEIWYGATRWITKCSWHLPTTLPMMDHSNNRARQLMESIFPTTTTKGSSTWTFDFEREQSVFENSDSTMRLSLGNTSPKKSSDSPSTNQNIAVEYDSAKYANRIVDTTTIPKLSLIQAPTISVNIQTPIVHPRVELRTKTTWIIQKGGDDNGNYYGGTHYFGGSSVVSSSSPVEQRLEVIRDGYRSMVPRSSSQYNGIDDCDSSITSSTMMTTMERVRTFGKKLSHWIEQDGWMPKRVTTDLMGNFHTISEVGFSSSSNTNNNDESRTNDKKTIVPMMDSMGMRLRISKRIDWTSLGIFPWSSNNNQRQSSNHAHTPTRVRLDICGLHNSGDALSQIGCELDPLKLRDSFKVVIGCDNVVAL